MPIEEATGGIIGDLILTKAGLMLGVVGVVIIGLSLGVSIIFSDSEEDFIEAKKNKQSIKCIGLFNSYTIDYDKYEVKDKTIIMKRNIFNKKFFIADCDILM